MGVPKIGIEPTAVARAITDLRVSVTNRCDFRCVYCMSENMTFLPKKELLTLEELDRLCSTFVDLGVEKLRITGGEPLVRSEASAAGRQTRERSECARSGRAQDVRDQSLSPMPQFTTSAFRISNRGRQMC